MCVCWCFRVLVFVVLASWSRCRNQWCWDCSQSSSSTPLPSRMRARKQSIRPWYLVIVTFTAYWPLKINIEPESHLFKKENHLPSTSICLFKMFMFQGVCLTNSSGCSLGPFTVTTARDPRNILGGGFTWFLLHSLLTSIDKPGGNRRKLAVSESTLLFEIYWKFNWNL